MNQGSREGKEAVLPKQKDRFGLRLAPNRMVIEAAVENEGRGEFCDFE